ncbi:MAG: VWA domain-containing protein [Acidobacteria bacterium]|nr:VWA domain-containing protein [Acidobacteriota bacterium]
MKAVTAKVMLMRWLINVLLVLNLAATIAAQDEPIRVSTDIVTVPVTVLDKDGRYVTNLTKDNFKIIENGVEQDVSYFETVDKNVTVMLLLDLSGSMNDYIEPLGRSAAAFIAKLREDDRIIVAGFADDSKLHILQEPIKKKDFRQRIRLSERLGDSITTTFDAVEKAMQYMDRITGRKAIVLFTDGELFGRRASQKDNLRDAREQEALIYTIRFGDSAHQPGLYAAGSQFPLERKLSAKELATIKATVNAYLEGLSTATGGRSFDLDEVSDLEATFQQVSAELGQQYLIGYSPITPAKDGERRKITVNVNIPNVAVRSRNEVVFKKK